MSHTDDSYSFTFLLRMLKGQTKLPSDFLEIPPVELSRLTWDQLRVPVQGLKPVGKERTSLQRTSFRQKKQILLTDLSGPDSSILNQASNFIYAVKQESPYLFKSLFGLDHVSELVSVIISLSNRLSYSPKLHL